MARRKFRIPPRVAVACIGLGVLAIMTVFTWRIWSVDDPEQALKRGLAALEAGQPRTARVELMNAIKADPSLVAARIAQARVYLALGDGALAQAEIDRARALGATPASTRALMGHAWLLQGEPSKAVVEAQAPDLPTADLAYAERIAGQALQALGDLPMASRAFGHALTTAPKDGKVWTDVARFRRDTGDQAGAIAASASAVAFAPTSADTLTLRGILVRDQFGMAAALPWFDRAVAIDPGYVPALAEYAATLADTGQARRAVAISRKLLALDPGNPRALLVQALVAARAGKDDLARTLVAKVGGDANGWPAVQLLRGALLIRAGSDALAVEQLQRLVQAQPDNATARLLLARALHGADSDDQVPATVTPLLAQGGYASLLAARAQERLGNRAAADADLEQAVWPREGALALAAGGSSSTDPRAASSAIPTIRGLLARGDVAGALAQAAVLRDANRSAPAASLVLGDAWMAARRPLDAVKAYEVAANLRFDEDTALRLLSAWRAAGRNDKAASVLSLYLRQNPTSIAANRIAAGAWADAGDWTRAADMLESLRARLGDNDALLMTDLAWAWLGKGDTDRALTYARNAYRLQPASPFTSDVYGWAMLKAGRKGPAALDLLEKAASLAPQSPVIREHLIEVRAGGEEVMAAL